MIAGFGLLEKNSLVFKALQIHIHRRHTSGGSCHFHIKIIIDHQTNLTPGHFHRDIFVTGTHFTGNCTRC